MVCLIPLLSYGQATILSSGQAIPQGISAPNITWVRQSDFRIFTAITDSLKIKNFQLNTWFPDTMNVMRANINSKLAKADTTGKWKPVGWFPTWTQVTSKPTFSTIAGTGDYNDLINKPIFTKSLVGLGNVDNTSDLNKPISNLTQTALNGKLSSEVDGSVTNELQTLSISGSTISISSGNSVLLPAVKRVETYTGTTDASGNYTITFSTVYSVAPNIQASIRNQSNIQQQIRVSSISTTGFTINVSQRNTLLSGLLGVEILLATTSNVNGASVDILVTEK